MKIRRRSAGRHRGLIVGVVCAGSGAQRRPKGWQGTVIDVGASEKAMPFFRSDHANARSP